MFPDSTAPLTADAERGYSEQVDSVILVGGGDNGLLTALALERYLEDVPITVIDDPQASRPRVGKSTLTFFVKFLHGILGIDGNRLLREVPLGFKTSVYFEDWCGVEPFHSPLGWSIPVVNTNPMDPSPPDRPEAEFQEYYYRYTTNEFTGIYEELAETRGKTPWKFVMGQQGMTMQKELSESAYHINTDSFNQFLREICRERGIRFTDDRIVTVETAEQHIDHLIGSGGEMYSADLFVDASGFNRVLISELETDVIRPDIPVDSAVKTSVDIPLSEIVSATVVTTGTAGWFWQIDTMGGRDLGYVYSSDHLSTAEAKREMIETREEAIDLDNLVELSWEPSVLRTPWVNNCVATGNALAFIEPLHSFTLAAASSLAYYLAVLLAKYGRINHANLRTLFNHVALTKWEEIYNFQSTLYKYNSGSSDFWRTARDIDAGDFDQYHTYRHSGFGAPSEWDRLTRTDTDQNPYFLYFLLFRSLGIESDLFESIDLDVDSDVIEEINEYKKSLPGEVDQYMSYEELYHSIGLDYE